MGFSTGAWPQADKGDVVVVRTERPNLQPTVFDPFTVTLSAPSKPRAAPIFALAGALLMLLALYRPIFQIDFTVDELVPNLTSYSVHEVNSAWRTDDVQQRASVAGLQATDWESDAVKDASAPSLDPERVETLRGHMVRLGPSHPRGISAAEFARFLVGTEPGAFEPSASLLNPSPAAREQLSSTRTILAIILGVGALAGLIAAYAIIRALKPLDTLQVAAHGALGTVGVLAFGTLVAFAWFDPLVGRQLVKDGLVMGLFGALGIWISAVLGGQRRHLLTAPLLGIVLLAAVGGSGYLFVTL